MGTSRNQEEGNKTAARAYDRAAARHARSGAVDRAARSAAREVDRHGAELRVAETFGKAPARGEDALLYVPGWWTESHASAWDRVKAALRRDWEQTKRDLTRSRGPDLNQSAADTVKQAAGTEPIPRGRVPTMGRWEDVEPAMRFGYSAAVRYREESWAEAASKLQRDWYAIDPPYAWEHAEAYARTGWSEARGTRPIRPEV